MVVMTNLFQYAIIHINKTAPCFYAPLLKGWIVAFIPSPWYGKGKGKGGGWEEWDEWEEWEGWEEWEK